MDSTLVTLVLSKVAETAVSQIPGLVASHPKSALTMFAAVWAWEHVVPMLPTKANSTGGLIAQGIINIIKAMTARKKG